MRFLYGLAAIVLVATPVAAETVSQHARESVRIIGQLRAIGLPDPDALEKGPPPKVPGLLRQLNTELKALIVEILNDSGRSEFPNSEEVFAQLRAAGWSEIPDHKWNAYGELLGIKFDWHSGFDPTVLVVATQLWVPCGESDPDSMIYVLRGGARKWDLVLAAAADFNPLDSAWDSGMRYEISPPDTHGDFYLAIARTPPACRDEPPYLRYEIVAPGQLGKESKTILTGRESIDPDFMPSFVLQAESDWFAITRGKIRKLDGEPGVSIERYQFSGDQLSRVAPLALRPEDFVDEWAQLSWDEASHWSAAAIHPDIKDWHSLIHNLAGDSAEFHSVRGCPANDSDSSSLVTLWIDRQANPTVQVEELYISVVKNNGAFTVEQVRKTPDPQCTGRNTVAKVPDWNLPGW